MNRRMVLYIVGQMIKLEAVLMLLPLFVAVIYKNSCFTALLITIAIALILGYLLTTVFKPSNRLIFAKEGFVVVALSWIILSAIGALPFVISGEIPSFADAFFETVSGFTTTGSSILTDVEAMSEGLLFWRSFTHWVGGMGILVFIMAIIPSATDRSIHILKAEVPGPIVGKLVPKIKDTAKILYLIYIFMTIVEIVLLLCGGMSLFDSCLHAFGTAGTGGFGIKADSVASYSPYLQWVITIFMLLFALNFNLYYLAILRKFRAIAKSGEMWLFIVIYSIAVLFVTINIYPLYENVADSLRLSAFQVSSIITTTGYSTADFNLWPGLSKSILLLVMFFGGCAGSTAGGLKMSRVLLLLKIIKREIQRMLHPRSVGKITLEGKKVDDSTIRGVTTYFAVYVACFVLIFFAISFEDFSIETNLSAVASCFNNIGPGLGAVGPMSSFAGYSALSKYILSIAMLLGRLEIYPILIALTPSTWSKR